MFLNSQCLSSENGSPTRSLYRAKLGTLIMDELIAGVYATLAQKDHAHSPSALTKKHL